MALSIFLGIWGEDRLRRVKVEDVDLESNVEVLKPFLTKELGDNACESFVLTFCGLLLEDKKPLSSYGITSGVTIHVTAKPKLTEPSKPDYLKINETVVQEFVSSFRNFKVSPTFRSTLHRLENPAELDKVIAAVPGLENDPLAIAFISKPDLLTQMEDPKTCRQIGKSNPVIFAAARYIVTEFHKTTAITSSPLLHPPPSSGHSYSLDALSDDDDDMEGDGPSSGAITAAQLAAALASASSAPATRITSEMLQQALSPAGGASRYASQLRQMRELGLNEEGRNLRALTAAAGDLQAAIDLVFSGALDD